MKNNLTILSIALILIAFCAIPNAVYSQAGSLDTTFDSDGIVTTPFGNNTDHVESISIQSDGKIVAVGTSHDNFKYVAALARYNLNGSLDSTYDNDGKIITSGGNYNYFLYASAIQADNKIVVAGSYDYSPNKNFLVIRYNTNGSLDTTFDYDGKVKTPVGVVTDRGYSVAIQIDGKIVVAGESWGGIN